MANILVICMLISNWLRDPKIKCYHIRYIYISIYIYIMDFRKWKWRDIWPSMVTILGICALQLTHPMCTHSVNTHLGLCCGAWGAGGWVPCSSEPQSFVLRVERALDIHSPHLQFLLAWDSNMQPLDYKSDSLTISPRPPPPPVRHLAKVCYLQFFLWCNVIIIKAQQANYHIMCIEFCMWISVLFVIYYYFSLIYKKNSCINISLQSLNT